MLLSSMELFTMLIFIVCAFFFLFLIQDAVEWLDKGLVKPSSFITATLSTSLSVTYVQSHLWEGHWRLSYRTQTCLHSKIPHVLQYLVTPPSVCAGVGGVEEKKCPSYAVMQQLQKTTHSRDRLNGSPGPLYTENMHTSRCLLQRISTPSFRPFTLHII